MGPRYLQSQIHADYSTGSSTWSDYRNQIELMYATSNSKEDFNDHLIREYNRKIDRLNQSIGLYISPFDAGFRFIGDPIIESTLLNNLIAYWRMEELSGTRYDSHGSNHLAIYGTDDPSVIESGGGVIGNSAIQNDLDEYVSLYIAPSPYDAVNSSWSLSFWMSTNDNGDDTNQMFPNAWSNCCLWRIRTLEGDTHQTVEGTIWYDELNAGTAFNANKSGIYEGGFVHIAVTHDLPTKTVRVYYNGIEEHVFVYDIKLSSVSPGNNYENTLLSMFAGDVGGLNYPGPGKLDEVGIWGRVLTSSEVTALYNNGDGLAYAFGNVTGLYAKQYNGYYLTSSNAVDFFNNNPTLISGNAISNATYDNFPISQSLIIKGYFKPTSTGPYEFKLASDDASYLWIGQEALDNNRTIGNYSIYAPATGGIYEGTYVTYLNTDVSYPLTIVFGNDGGPGALQFSYIPPGSTGYISNLNNVTEYNSLTKGH